MKRSLSVSDDEDPQPMPKRVRFPKGKKLKKADEIVDEPAAEDVPVDLNDPRRAAKERAKRRNQITREVCSDQGGTEMLQDVSVAEVNYEDTGVFEDDGVLIEPFNLKQEREEGYFDANGNFIEYVSEKEIKDAWLDSVDVDPKFVETNDEDKEKNKEGEVFHDLSSEDIGKTKRRIANLLRPGETVLQALRRLKGISNGRKEKMPEDTKRMFDQLTEDSMKLMENGDYNVYHDTRDIFEREAEGYERLARAKEGTTRAADNGSNGTGDDIFSIGVGVLPDTDKTSIPYVQGSSGDDDSTFDMFGEEDDSIPSDQPVPGDGSQQLAQPGLENLETDYVFDESSGYYYSSKLGYYYDPNSGFYCSATTGTWYAYNEETGAYDEIQGEATADAS